MTLGHIFTEAVQQQQLRVGVLFHLSDLLALHEGGFQRGVVCEETAHALLPVICLEELVYF